MERCYDLQDNADLLAVTSETNKRSEALPKEISGTNCHLLLILTP